ncbi:MAG: hypothetical protein ABI404_15395, partial [Bradyrhizobium sp.]
MTLPVQWGSGLRAAPLQHIHHIYCVDCEYDARRGNRPEVVCMVVHDLRTGETHRYWQDELRNMTRAP